MLSVVSKFTAAAHRLRVSLGHENVGHLQSTTARVIASAISGISGMSSLAELNSLALACSRALLLASVPVHVKITKITRWHISSRSWSFNRCFSISLSALSVEFELASSIVLEI